MAVRCGTRIPLLARYPPCKHDQHPDIYSQEPGPLINYIKTVVHSPSCTCRPWVQLNLLTSGPVAYPAAGPIIVPEQPQSELQLAMLLRLLSPLKSVLPVKGAFCGEINILPLALY